MSRKKTTKRTYRKRKKQTLAPVWVFVISLSLIILSLLGMFELGAIGVFLSNCTKLLFGDLPVIYFALVIFASIAWIFRRKGINLSSKQKLAVFFLWISLSLLFVLSSDNSLKGMNVIQTYFKDLNGVYNGSIKAQGGIFGALFYGLFTYLFDRVGTMIMVGFLMVLALILYFYPSVSELQEKIWNKDVKLKPLMKKSGFKWKKDRPKQLNIDDYIEDEDMDVFVEFEPIDMATALKKEINSKTPSKVTFIEAEPVSKKVQLKPKIEEKENQKTLSDSTGIVEQDSKYELPSLALLDNPTSFKGSLANNTSASQKGLKLIEILETFGIKATIIETHIGPAVTKFELRLDSSVKVSRIQSLQDNIMMELAVKEIRIEAPIPGKNAVGIEIPNIEMSPVRLIQLIESIPLKMENDKLLLALGKNLMGTNIYGVLNRMPHLLIAGATGSGKSVCVNSMIATLLLRTKPSEVKLLLIDPKKVEFAVFNDVPHLIAPVISDPVMAAKALNVIVKMMENRYDEFSKVGARNISSYNEKANQDKTLKPMPSIVVIIDELADLMMVSGKEVESSIQRITQLARAAGIHLVVATQRPSVDVITGVIKANIPSRIAFAVSSGTDSRTILDATGAERLLGYGDMLYQPVGEQHPIRIQGVFISDDEVARVANAVKEKSKPFFDDAFINLDGVSGNDGFIETSNDPLFEEVKEYVIEAQKASTSLLQRRFGIGYNRAARMIDALEEACIIGPVQGSKPRDVYVKPDDEVQEGD